METLILNKGNYSQEIREEFLEMERDVTNRRDILKLIAARTREGRTASYRTLVRELDLSEESACEYLKRLWRERLLNRPDRPGGFPFRLRPGDRLPERRL